MSSFSKTLFGSPTQQLEQRPNVVVFVCVTLAWTDLWSGMSLTLTQFLDQTRFYWLFFSLQLQCYQLNSTLEATPLVCWITLVSWTLRYCWKRRSTSNTLSHTSIITADKLLTFHVSLLPKEAEVELHIRREKSWNCIRKFWVCVIIINNNDNTVYIS